MSYVYILTQTDYKHYEDYEKEENRDVSVLYVYSSVKAANEAAAAFVEEYFDDGDNEVEQDKHGCDTWTCTLERDDQSHVLIAVDRKELYGDVEEIEVDGDGVEDGSENEGGTEGTEEDNEGQEPPSKKARRT